MPVTVLVTHIKTQIPSLPFPSINKRSLASRILLLVSSAYLRTSGYSFTTAYTFFSPSFNKRSPASKILLLV
jgi:hypothetical protein